MYHSEERKILNSFDKKILEILLRKPASNAIPRTGDRALSVDSNVVYLKAQDGQWTLLVRKLDDNGVYGKFWLNEVETEEFCIPFSLLKSYEADITHFYGIYDLRYNSFSQYFFEGIVPVDKVRIVLGKAQQFLFNRKQLIRSERVEALKIILEQDLENRNFKTSAVHLTTLLHSNKWVYHPDKTRQIKYNELLLKSLADSGDLEIDRSDFGFKLSPKALTTIADYENDMRKHQEAMSQAKAMKWLTFALIFVGLIQAGVTLYGMAQSGT
ncbi:hypothetical protein DXJ84_24785 [Vibrio parahaemolyticus]|uniref:hypothetical protein n=1 Tax=Vibrio parahaemolyticus TaxID=670 RepID=UPI00111F852C|nr:hypothetical protein [Vibrio parahaemolyticus]TPA20936.1 hypothetical protein DXJ84_24785 [Vibrio parahaemolyticus]